MISKHKPTSEQSIIINNISPTMSRFSTINALPGTGKTFTIAEMVRKVLSFQPDAQILVCAYNKMIADSLVEKLKDKPTVIIGTIHAIAFHCLKKYINKSSTPLGFCISELKNNDIVKDTFTKKGLSVELMDCMPFSTIDKVFNLMREKLCNSSYAISMEYGFTLTNDKIELPFNIYDVLDEIFEIIYDNPFKPIEGYYYNGYKMVKGKYINIDFTDQIYLPYIKKLTSGVSFDYVFIDEAQDNSELKWETLLSMGDEHTKYALFGDINQTINQYAGSSSALFRKIALEADNYQLTCTMRCPKKVVEFVNIYFPELNFQAHENNIEGYVGNCDLKDLLERCKSLKEKETLYVMNTKNTPLFQIYLYMIKNGINPTLKGSDIQDYILKLLKGCKTLSELKVKISKILGFSYKSIKSVYRELSPNKIHSHNAFKKHNEPIEILFALLEFYFDINFENETLPEISIETIEKQIRTVYSNTNKSNITLLTCHKSKGMEADYVYILDFENLTNPKEGENIEQNKNLLFVTLTRSLKEFIMVNPYELKELQISGSEDSSEGD